MSHAIPNVTIDFNLQNQQMTLFIVRHGERLDFMNNGHWDQSWWNDNKMNRPWDPRLSPSGRLQAEDAGALILSSILKDTPVEIITSPFQRCAETALCLANGLGSAAPSKIFVDTALCESLYPAWFGQHHFLPDFMLKATELHDALKGQYHSVLIETDPTSVLAKATYPEDDAAHEARADAVAAAVIARATTFQTPRALVLVTHGGVACSIVRAVKEICKVATEIDTRIPHMGFCSVNILKVKGGQITHPPVLGALPLRLTPTQRWFSAQEQVWDRLILPKMIDQKSKTNGKLSMLELGSWEGASASWLLTNGCNSHAESSLVCVDHYDMLRTPAGIQRAEKFQHNMRLTGLWHKVQLIVNFTVPALHQLLQQKREWDFVYVDASHEAADTLLDAMLAWKGVKKGGLLVFDDYEWPTEQVGPLHPKPGIDAFLQIYAHELEILHRGYQIIVVKTVGPRFNF
jgi:broad specificity phosphatase PhoE/predicted O-methyltransferase YrrM